jgi:hypothetical protein
VYSFFFYLKNQQFIGGAQAQSTPAGYLSTNQDNHKKTGTTNIQKGNLILIAYDHEKDENLLPTAHNGLILATLPSRSLTRAHIYLFLLAHSVAYLLVIHL